MNLPRSVTIEPLLLSDPALNRGLAERDGPMPGRDLVGGEVREAGSLSPLGTEHEPPLDWAAVSPEGIAFRPRHGGGISAQRSFCPGEVIERAPVLLLPDAQLSAIRASDLAGCCCKWGQTHAFSLGLAPVYRHSDIPNAKLVKKLHELVIEVVALREVAAGEEILVDRGDLGDEFWLSGKHSVFDRRDLRDSPADRRRARGEACREASRIALQAQARNEPRTHSAAVPSLHLALASSCALELLRVPSGVFPMGADERDSEVFLTDSPLHDRYLPEYDIGRFPVTVRQFSCFVRATGYCTRAEREGKGWVYRSGWHNLAGADWQHPFGPESGIEGRDEHPITLVSWNDAVAFCAWASAVSGHRVELPTEAQWEKAARGTDARPWPWGRDAPDESRCRCASADTVPVGQFSPRGDSPWGCADMAGNVLEWTASTLAPYPFESSQAHGGGAYRVLRGGGFDKTGKWLRSTARYWWGTDHRMGCIGFRVCVSGHGRVA